MHSQYIVQSEPEATLPSTKFIDSTDFDEFEEDKKWDEALYKAMQDDYVSDEEDAVIQRRSTRWHRLLSAVCTIGYETGQSFVYSAAFLPTNDYDRGIGIISGYLVTPLCEAINQLVSKNQDVRVILRAQHTLYDGNAVAGFAKMFAKHILSPLIPALIAVYATDDPVKDFEHSFIHAALHATVGYSFYKLCSTLANKKWPFKEVELKALSPKAQFVQDYIAAPVLAGFPRMVLVAEFLRKTGFGVFKWIDDQDLHAPLVFGSSYFIYHGWRMHTREFRKVQPYVTFDEKALEAQESTDEQVLTKSYSQKTSDLLKGSLKIIPIFIGGACGNYLYSQIVGTTHDDLLLERTQRDAFVAMGMYAAFLTLKAAEQATKKILTSCMGFFSQSTRNGESKRPVQEKKDFKELPQGFPGMFSSVSRNFQEGLMQSPHQSQQEFPQTTSILKTGV